jgi:hypothetical protein
LGKGRSLSSELKKVPEIEPKLRRAFYTAIQSMKKVLMKGGVLE